MRKVVNDKLVYLDTCVVSGIVKNVLNESDSEAMVALLSADESESFRFVASSVVLDEINQIPNKHHRTPHLIIYNLFENVSALHKPSISSMGLDGGIAGNPNHRIWSRLRAILPDENDAKHLYQAVQNGASFFVTVDYTTILRYKTEIGNEFNIVACSPTELFQVASEGNNNASSP